MRWWWRWCRRLSRPAVSIQERTANAANFGGHVPVDMTPTAVCLCTRPHLLLCHWVRWSSSRSQYSHARYPAQCLYDLRLLSLLHYSILSLSNLPICRACPSFKKTSKQYMQSPDFPAPYARRISVPSQRKPLPYPTSASSCLYGANRRLFRFCLSFAVSAKLIGPTLFKRVKRPFVVLKVYGDVSLSLPLLNMFDEGLVIQTLLDLFQQQVDGIR